MSNVMVDALSSGGYPDDDTIERDGDKMLARLLKGGRVKLIGVDATNHIECSTVKPCKTCDSGSFLTPYESNGEHALCLSCMRATKHLQRSIDKVLKTIESRRRFARSVRLAELKMRSKDQRFKRAGARPNAKNAAFIQSLIDKA